ncbi:HipA family kinase [Parafrankia discariae]|uniref:HipA family kinase n=1 Tax=Parafrankia discariae TaxID=365528 RepID=UPI00037E46FD|nr:HipA family kinase [Parafrankia discariae]
MLRHVLATRYATPLREGGSLPGVMEGDDLGTWVVKFTGAGQGPKALVAEVIVGELARGLGLAVPELVLVDVDPDLGRTEPDQEVQDLLRASPGRNLGMDYLPGSITYDPLAFPVEPALAARVIWLDAFTLNVDRSWRNPNLLVWGARLWLIDHGAALYPHHDWAGAAAAVDRPLPGFADHVLLPVLGADAPDLLAAVDRELAPAVTAELLSRIVGLVPPEWAEVPGSAYVDWLLSRVSGERPWLAAMLAPTEPLVTRSEPARRAAGRGTGRPDWLRGGSGA